MKVDEQLRASFTRQKGLAEKLKVLVDQEISARKRSGWHYESRTKEEESFALKVEAGRVPNPNAIEDAFGCVLVVPNFADIAEAEEVVVQLYGNPVQRRPESHDLTRKLPSDFRFDDLRMYMSYVDQGFGPESGLAGTLFEVQIRTFLQHAWMVATHDIVYKADDVSWRRERVAHEARAALEQVEVTIDNMATLENSSVLPRSSEAYDATQRLIVVLKAHWAADQLPRDLRRLAEAIYELLRNVRLEEAAFGELLDSGRSARGGTHNLDWSPYRSVIEYLAEYQPAKLKAFLTNPKARGSAFVYPSVLARLELDAGRAPKAIVLS